VFFITFHQNSHFSPDFLKKEKRKTEAEYAIAFHVKKAEYTLPLKMANFGAEYTLLLNGEKVTVYSAFRQSILCLKQSVDYLCS
jgi:hypothetical protein